MTHLKPKSNRTIKGTRLAYNAGSQNRYRKQLTDLIDSISSDVTKEVTKFFEKPLAENYFAQDASVASQAEILMNALMAKFSKILNIKAKTLAESMVKTETKNSATSLKASTKKISDSLTLNTNFVNKDLKEILKASVSENVNLIKSIGEEYLTQVKGSVLRSITTGNGLASLVPALQKQKGISYRKAKNIALDQTRKVYNNINVERMRVLGFEEYEWLHSGGGQRPRKDHIAMNGKIYRLDNPPVIDRKTGERGHPGQAINCGCTMRPVVKFKEG